MVEAEEELTAEGAFRGLVILAFGLAVVAFFGAAAFFAEAALVGVVVFFAGTFLVADALGAADF